MYTSFYSITLLQLFTLASPFYKGLRNVKSQTHLHSQNKVPLMWEFISRPLKDYAREWFIKRAISKGIDWKNLTDFYKTPQNFKNLDELKNQMENKSIYYPDYFLQPFHGYDYGNMNWLAAQENEAAALSMCSNYWKNTSAIESEIWVRENVTHNVRSYIKNYKDPDSIDKILDVGCSGGISTEYISKGFPNSSHIYGLDLSPYFISIASFRSNLYSQFNKIKYVHANAENTPFPDNHFDFIICNFIFHEVPQNATNIIINEMKRILAPGGILAIVDLDPETLKDNLLLSNFRKWAFEVTEPHIYGYYNSDFCNKLSDFGFHNVFKRKNDPINYVITCTKPN